MDYKYTHSVVIFHAAIVRLRRAEVLSPSLVSIPRMAFRRSTLTFTIGDPQVCDKAFFAYCH